MSMGELSSKSTIVHREGLVEVATPDHETYQFSIEDGVVKYDEGNTPTAKKVYQLVLSETDYQEDPSFNNTETTSTKTETAEKTPTTSNPSEWPIEIVRERTVPEELVQELPKQIESIVQEDGYKYYVEEMGGSLSFNNTVTEKWEIYQDGSVVVSVVED